MNRRGYPDRETKKQRQKVQEDKRPHVRMSRLPEVPEVQQIKIRSTKLWYDFNLSRPVGRNWTKKEAHALIDMWAGVCWGLNSEIHKSMSCQVGLLPQLWNKQKGKCAVSGLELGGGPGDGRRAIGIDIIQRKRGVSKGNVRLVCGPLAYTRWIEHCFACPKIEMPHPENYVGYDITFAIAKHIQLALKNEFKHLPVLVTFPLDHDPEKNKDHTYIVPLQRNCFNIVEFSWFSMVPSRPDLEEGFTGWECNSRLFSKYDFMRVTLQDDIVVLHPFKKPRHGMERYKHFPSSPPPPLSPGPRYEPNEDQVRVPLADPDIDIIEMIIRHAKKGLIKSMRYWYDSPYP